MSDLNKDKFTKDSEENLSKEKSKVNSNPQDEVDFIDEPIESIVDDTDVDELLDKFDKESSRVRKLSGKIALISSIIAIAMSLFHIYTAAFGTLQSLKQRSLHILFAFILGLMLYPARKKGNKNRPTIIDAIFMVIVVIVFGYIFTNVEEIAIKGGQMTRIDYIFGIAAILLTLEITRRVVGPELPIVTIIFLIYAKFGRNMPGLLAHRGFNVQRIVSHMYLTTEGIMGTPIAVSSTFVFMFILFGAFLDKTGVGKFFIDFAFALTGSTKSGPAMTSVLSSGLMGSISGSSVANTVTTGAFTIPLMKRTGYEPHYAGAVEAASSTGGQIMPPVMGAAAFIMADFTGFKYVSIIKAALIPAILYYIAIGTMVHLEASKKNLKGIPRNKLPSIKKIFKDTGYLIIPLVIIIYMLIKQFTPTFAALTAIITATIIATIASLVKKDNSFTLKTILSALDSGAKAALGVICACACAGMVVGVVTLTGFGLRIAELIVKISGGNLILTLLLTMIASIILGMGLPTTAKYIVLATMAVPALTHLNVNLMAAHLFILYFGVVADVTPPVALAAYAGAGIAGANSMKTGVQAFKLSMAAFIIPYIFAINPALIMVEGTVGSTIQWLPFTSAIPNIITAIIGIICLGGAMEGYLFDHAKLYERIVLLAAAFTLLIPGWTSDIVGIVVLVILFFIQTRRKKARELKTA
ncbi:MAG: TRAP transporter permease [Tissierellia bacterium]|nr:TRAP transporter permease [Tissierellia bacterium]